MKVTKKAFQFLCLGLALLIGNGLSAQTESAKPQNGARKPMTAEERAMKRTDKQKAELGLSDDQYKKVLELNRKQAKDMESMRTDAKEEHEKRAEKMKAKESDHEAEMSKILTPEQYQKFKANKENRRDKMKSHHKGGRKPGEKGKQRAPKQEE